MDSISNLLLTQSNQSVETIKWLMMTWIGRLELLTTVYVGLGGIFIALMAFLTWNHSTLRREVEKNVQSINETKNKMDQLYVEYDKLMKSSMELFIQMQSNVNAADKDLERVKQLSEDITNKKIKLKNVDEKLQEIIENLDNNVNVKSKANIESLDHYFGNYKDKSTEYFNNLIKSIGSNSKNKE